MKDVIESINLYTEDFCKGHFPLVNRSFEEFKQIKDNGEWECVKKIWNELGLTYGFDYPDLLEKLIYAYHQETIWIVNKAEDDIVLETIAYPIIRRIFNFYGENEVERDFNFNDFTELLEGKYSFNEFYSIIESLDSDMDVEAEAAAATSDLIIAVLTSNDEDAKSEENVKKMFDKVVGKIQYFSDLKPQEKDTKND